jgi:hypothetical protein
MKWKAGLIAEPRERKEIRGTGLECVEDKNAKFEI